MQNLFWELPVHLAHFLSSSLVSISVVDAILVKCPACNSQFSFTWLLHRICHDWSPLDSWTISLLWQRGHHHFLIFLMAHWLHLLCLYCWILFFLRCQAGTPQSSVLPSLFYTHSFGEFIHTPSFTKHVHTKALNLSLVSTFPWVLDFCTPNARVTSHFGWLAAMTPGRMIDPVV